MKNRAKSHWQPQNFQTPLGRPDLVAHWSHPALTPWASEALPSTLTTSIPWSWGYKCFKYPGKQRLKPIHRIHSLKRFLYFFSFFSSFFFSSERRENARASQKRESLVKLPRKPGGVTDLTWQGEGFTRPYAWLNRDARSLGLRRGTSIKGSCHLTTCFHKQKSVTAA